MTTEEAPEAGAKEMMPQEIAEAIEEESERQVIERLGYAPTTWYFGGPQHNDYRLQARVYGDDVLVSDGCSSILYARDASLVAIKQFVSEWLDAIMHDEDGDEA